jgi:hypothetical protein
MSTRALYIAKMRRQLAELDVQMNLLEARALDVQDGARDKYQEEIGQLRHQSGLVVAKLQAIKTAGEDTWETLVDEMEKVRKAFTNSFQYLKSKI